MTNLVTNRSRTSRLKPAIMPAIRASRSANSLQYPPSDDEGAPAPRSAAFTLSPLIISSPLPTTGRNSPVSAVTAPPDSPVSYSGESSPLLLEQPYLPAPTTRAALHPPPALPQLLPDPSFRFPSSTDVTSSDARPATAPTNQGARAGPGLTKSSSISSMSSTSTESTSYTAPSTSARSTLAHPYARIYAKKADPAVKRRRMWNHALEKSVFTPEEIATLGAQARRTMYTASLEAHVDKLHEQLRAIGLTPIAPERLEPYHGLNVITVKVRRPCRA